MGAALFMRNLSKYGQDVALQDRDIQPPAFGSPDFTELFSGDATVRALIDTKRGSTLFDGVATDQNITHKLCIAWIASITAEKWVQLQDGRRLDIVDVENCGEKNQLLVLRCTERGTGEAAKA